MSQKSVAVVSPFSATIALFCDSVEKALDIIIFREFSETTINVSKQQSILLRDLYVVEDISLAENRRTEMHFSN